MEIVRRGKLQNALSITISEGKADAYAFIHEKAILTSFPAISAFTKSAVDDIIRAVANLDRGRRPATNAVVPTNEEATRASRKFMMSFNRLCYPFVC